MPVTNFKPSRNSKTTEKTTSRNSGSGGSEDKTKKQGETWTASSSEAAAMRRQQRRLNHGRRLLDRVTAERQMVENSKMIHRLERRVEELSEELRRTMSVPTVQSTSTGSHASPVVRARSNGTEGEPWFGEPF